MKQLLISEELLRQVLKALTDVWGGYELQHQITDSITALRTTLEQPAVQPEKLGSEWVPCMKLPVVVHVRNQRDGERHVSTREGITPVKPDDLIMRGVSGEEYPIGRAIFDQTYTFDIAAQLAPVQEPVAWASQTALDIAAEGGEGIIVGAEADCLIPLYTVPQPVPVQEPVAEVKVKMTGSNAGIATVIHEIYDPLREPLQPGSRDKAWAVAKSLQAQVNILLPVVWAAADDDDEYGIGPKARKALEALAAHKET